MINVISDKKIVFNYCFTHWCYHPAGKNIKIEKCWEYKIIVTCHKTIVNNILS